MLEIIVGVGYSNTTMIWEGINQRKFPRVNYRCLVHVSRKGTDKTIETVTENIGAGGVCVRLDSHLQMFEDVSIELFLNGENHHVSCTGMVVWVVKEHPVSSSGKNHYDIGIEFLNMSVGDRKKIVKIVEEHMSSRA